VNTCKGTSALPQSWLRAGRICLRTSATSFGIPSEHRLSKLLAAAEMNDLASRTPRLQAQPRVIQSVSIHYRPHFRP
jgi:hypothetical protein